MTLLDRLQSGPGLPGIKTTHLLLAGILLLAVVTRFWRLGTPDQCYFDEVYFPPTGAEILRGREDAWDFYGHENTHPPLSKEIMALGMAIFGTQSAPAGDNQCWPDEEDAPRRTDPEWLFKPFGWRFFGALAGVGSVLFMFLIARRLFQSEVAGLASASFLTFDGLALAQARIGTPDTYVLLFVLGTVYFLISNRFLLSGVFLGAAAATKWIGAFTIVPVIIYLIIRLLRGFQDTKVEAEFRGAQWAALGIGAQVAAVLVAVGAAISLLIALLLLPIVFAGALARLIQSFEVKDPDGRMRFAEQVMLAGVGGLAVAAFAGAIGAFIGEGFAEGLRLAAPALGVFLVTVLAAVAVIAATGPLRAMPRGRLYLEMAVVFPIFFVLVPAYVYLATYIPAFLNGQSVSDIWDLNRRAYEFHSTLTSPHGYSSTWLEWPIMKRPIYFYVGDGNAKIYALGNPAVFWMGIPAIVFVLWQGLQLKARIRSATGDLSLAGAFRLSRWPLLFVAVSFLGVWLPWSTQPRILFIYHYLPALCFVILALGYCVHRLWHHPEPWGRTVAAGMVVIAGVTFAYFYPHVTAMEVPGTLGESYFWFSDWR
jgi:dolichyl-phosphate-mannose--protein O-mannosyl transferase